MRVCVFTAIYGDYDLVHPQADQNVPTDFVCFTEQRRPAAGRDRWLICRDLRLPGQRPRLRAKWFRTHAHLLFRMGRPSLRHSPGLAFRHPRRRYDLVIWIDGRIAIRNANFVRDMAAAIGDAGMAMFRLPDRDCIFDEAAESLTLKEDEGLPLLQQVEAYRAEGYPAHRGLMATGIVVSRPTWPHLSAVHEAWWRENLRWTYQDQLSLPVVQWRLGVTNAWIDGHLWFNDWFDAIPHKRNEGRLPRPSN